jgi:DNA-binding transcriptional regulator YiaG
MPNVIATLNDHIRRLARREVRAQTRVTKRATAHYRRDIASLKRLIKALGSRLAYVEKNTGAARTATAEAVPENARFRADGLRTHRAKLGLSAKDYGKLVGVSGLTIYHWEGGKSRPRRRQLAGVIRARGLGKREAMKRLSEG